MMISFICREKEIVYTKKYAGKWCGYTIRVKNVRTWRKVVIIIFYKIK